MKRVWTTVTVAPHEAGFAILLDGKLLRLHGANGLAVRQEALANAIAAEWRAAPPVFSLESLTLTRLAIAPQDLGIILGLRDRLAAYGASDVLCYRDGQDPELAAHEAQIWDPWLDWAAATFGARLKIGHGVAPVAQPPAALAALRKALTDMTVDELTALQLIIPALGSLVLGLAIARFALAPDAACDLAHLDELWQEARWGADPATAARRAGVAKDVAAAANFINLCRA